MRRGVGRSVLTWAALALMLVMCAGPFVFMILVSVARDAEFLSAQTPFEFTLESFIAVTRDPSLHFMDYLRNSVIVSLTAAGAAVVTAGLAAYAFTRLRFPFKGPFFLLVLAVSLFPQIGIVGYLFKLMTWLGWVNTYAALVFPYIAWTLPLALWILVSYFRQIPWQLEEAALVDGCSRLGILWRIVLPLAAPGFFSVMLLVFIIAFNEFMFALMLTTDHAARTVPVGIAMFQGLHGQTPWGNIMAASVVSAVPVVAVTVLFQRFIIGGLTRGAVKG